MRCIEIGEKVMDEQKAKTINYNMRCIEIHPKWNLHPVHSDKLQHEMY